MQHTVHRLELTSLDVATGYVPKLITTWLTCYLLKSHEAKMGLSRSPMSDVKYSNPKTEEKHT